MTSKRLLKGREKVFSECRAVSRARGTRAINAHRYGTGDFGMAKTRSFLGAAGLAAAATMALSSGALADDDRKFGYSLTLTGVSDYLFRGISFTKNDPAFQPYLEFTYGNSNLTYYLGFWGSNVKNGVGDPWEMDIYAGARFVTGCLNWDVGVLYYTNPDAKNASNLDYVEFKAGVTTTIDKLTLGVTGYVTPDVGFASPVTETVEGSVAYALPKIGIFDPTFSALIGYTNAETSGFYPPGTPVFDAFVFGGVGGGVTQYAYWNAGVKLVVDKWFMDFRYWDTDISHADDPHDFAQSRFLFSAGVTLP
jgi:uncharacterized protein (TIGR02001 family)